jgi:antibiotic biosynthesis monooxygenase (ABM) superfamily enzyme
MKCRSCGEENEEWREECKKCGLSFEEFPLAKISLLVLLFIIGVWSAITGINILLGRTVTENRFSGVIFFFPILLALLITYFMRR